MDARTSESLAARISNELLPRVQQPAQYLGGELNQLARPGDWAAAEVRVAVAFPDTYSIGMSHLGCQILYWLCNHLPRVCAERVYCPWTDAEEVMRARRIPLFTWDTRQPVAAADILAVSLQYELCFTNLLTLLDLAGLPLRAAERDACRPQSCSPPDRACIPPAPGRFFAETPAEGGRAAPDWPIVLVGGPQADNSEPVAEFVDLVVFGDGEHSMAAIVEAVREYKRAGVPRREMIERIARRFAWVYAPNLYRAEYNADDTFAGLVPLKEGLPLRFDRCRTPDFETAPFPTRPLVPWTEVVHDRIAVEVMRGCPQVCRFCHAGYTKRPLNVRSVERVLEIVEEAYWATGHHEIGLLSLSTADYPHLRELADRANARFAARRVNLSFPSLRVDKMLQNIPWMANQVRKGGLTIAVEAANDDMRAAIRKKVTDGRLLDGVTEAYKAGWRAVKLYFMSGFPGERPEDIDGIWKLSKQVSEARRQIGKPPANVTASVGWLVPKPFTPLQWMAQPPIEYFREVRERLMQLSHGSVGRRGGYSSIERAEDTRVARPPSAGVAQSEAGAAPPPSAGSVSRIDRPRLGKRDKHVRITMPDPEMSMLEAVLARGDRRLSAVIERAWRSGCRFDGWTEKFNFRAWQEAFDATGIDPSFYAHRERGFDERLPWEHVGLHMSRGYLERSYDDMFAKIGEEKPAATRPLRVVETSAG